MTHQPELIPKKSMRLRGTRAYMTGRSRDSHGMAATDPNLENWLYAYDKAAAKNNYAVMPLLGRDPAAVSITKTARIKRVLELCEARPYTSREIATHMQITEACLRGYLEPLVKAGDLVKWRSPIPLAKGKPSNYYAVRMEQFEGFEDAPVRPVHKTWVASAPPMFEPMALLFGRTA